MDRDQLAGNNSINRLTAAAAVLPGVIMSLLTMGMLIADLLLQEMDSLQYYAYPAAFRVCSMAAAACGILCIVQGIMNNTVQLDAGTVTLGAFAVWMILSTLVNGVSAQSVTGVPFRYLGTADYIICLFAFMGCSSLIRSEGMRHLILMLYMITADLVAVTALYDRNFGAIAAYGNKTGLSAVFYHENHYAYFLVMAVLISSGYYIYGTGMRTYAGAASAVINLAALGINQTLGCILAAGCVIIFTLIMVCVSDRMRARRALILTLFMAAAASAAVILSSAVREDLHQLIFDIGSLSWGGNNGLAGHGRWKLWTETAGYIRSRPLFGYGCEGIEGMLMDATGVSSAHNEVLTCAAFFGIPGALLYCAGIVITLIGSLRDPGGSAARRIAFMAASGYFISSLMGVAMFYTLPFFYIFAGLCSGKPAGQKSI